MWWDIKISSIYLSTVIDNIARVYRVRALQGVREYICLASNPGSHPAFRTASDEKLDESLGSKATFAWQLSSLMELI